MKPMVNAKLTADRGRSENQAELLRTLSLPFSFSISLSLSLALLLQRLGREEMVEGWMSDGGSRGDLKAALVVGGTGDASSVPEMEMEGAAGDSKKVEKNFPLCLSFPSVSFLSLFTSFLCLSSFALCPLLFSPKTPTRTDGMKWTDRVEPTATFNSRKESVFC